MKHKFLTVMTLVITTSTTVLATTPKTIIASKLTSQPKTYTKQVAVTSSQDSSKTLIKQTLSKFKQENTEESVTKMSKLQSYLTFDVTSPSGLTEAEYAILLPDTLKGLEKSLIYCDKQGINGVVMLSIAILESDYGKSRIAKDKNNLLGYGAKDSSPYESAVTFKDFNNCIETVAPLLIENYLMKDGKYYNGSTLNGMNVKYCSSSLWASKVSNIMVDLMTKLEER